MGYLISFSLHNRKDDFFLDNKQVIKIIYTSDVHGNALPIIYGTNKKAPIGLTTYATVVKRAREKHEHLLVLDNGDLIQGTPFMTHYFKEHTDKENPVITLMNHIGIDAAIIGNHEFNFGRDLLNKSVQQSQFPWLSANILNGETDEPLFGKPYITKTFTNGIKIVVVGITTHFIPNWEAAEHIKGIRFRDAFTTLKSWVPYIHEKEKPDILIVSYHGGLERNLETGKPTEPLTGENQGYQMAKEIDGIDILLTGHQHRELTGQIGDSLVIQPGKHAHTYGEIDITLQYQQDEWMIMDKHAEVKDLKNIQADQELINRIEAFETSTQKWLDEPIGTIDGDMTITDPFQVRIKKHPFIEFIQHVQMDATGVDISVTSLLNNESTGFSTHVKMRDIVSNYIYPNTLTVLALTGKDILLALEKTATYFTIDNEEEIAVNPSYITPKPQHYNYDMWEGIEYTLNISKPVGSRVENVTYHGKPLEEKQTYHVAMNNYRAGGGGNFDMFKGKPVVKDIQRDMVTLIREYIERHEIITAKTTDNFHIIK